MTNEEYLAVEKVKLAENRTMGDLMELHRRYDDNFLSMVAALEDKDMEKYRGYMLLERGLEKLCTVIRKDLGIYIPDPCPLRSAKFCTDCTGWYMLNPENTRGSGKPKRKETIEGEGLFCALKEVG